MTRRLTAALGVVAVVAAACSSGSTAKPTPRPVAKPGQIVTVLSAKLGSGGVHYSRTGAFTSVGLDSRGNLYAADELSRDPIAVRVTPRGSVTTVLDCATRFPSRAPAHPPEPTCTEAPISAIQAGSAVGTLSGFAVDPAGTAYIVDGHGQRIRAISASGDRKDVAGTGGTGTGGPVSGPATSTALHSPTGAPAIDRAGDVYFLNATATVVKLGRDGMLSTVAGTGQAGFSGDGGPATQATLDRPRGLGVDAAGNVYIAEDARLRRVDVRGMITTVAGTGQRGYSGDGGPAVRAQFNGIYGLAFDQAGDIFLADHENNRVRLVRPDGVVTTAVGTGATGFAGDGGDPKAADLHAPWGLALDAAGNLYIGDALNFRVRMVGAVARP